MEFELREITPMKSENNSRTKIELFPFSLNFFPPSPLANNYWSENSGSYDSEETLVFRI